MIWGGGSGGVRLRGTLATLALLWTAPLAWAAVPGCVEQCDRLVERGELRPGMSAEGCVIRLCQREARTLYTQSRFEEALASLDRVREPLQGSPAYQLDQGLVLYGLGRFEEALASFDALLAGFPANVRAASQRGQTLIRLDRLDEARQQFEKLEANPAARGEFKNLRTRSYVVGNIGLIRLLKGDLEGGRADLERALEIDGRNQLAGTYLYTIVPALESGDLDAEGVTHLIAAYEELGFRRYLQAGKELQKLLAGSPRYAPGYHLLGDIFRAYQEYASCAQALAVGEKYLPDDLDLRAERLRCTLLHLGPTSDRAGKILKQVRKLSEQHPENNRLQQILVALDR